MILSVLKMDIFSNTCNISNGQFWFEIAHRTISEALLETILTVHIQSFHFLLFILTSLNKWKIILYLFKIRYNVKYVWDFILIEEIPFYRSLITFLENHIA